MSILTSVYVDSSLVTQTSQCKSFLFFRKLGHVTRSLVLYVCFVDRWLSFCTFSFGHCVVCSSSICGFWLPLWYLQTLITKISLISKQKHLISIKPLHYYFSISANGENIKTKFSCTSNKFCFILLYSVIFLGKMEWNNGSFIVVITSFYNI